MLSRVIAKNVGDVFFETQCRISIGHSVVKQWNMRTVQEQALSGPILIIATSNIKPFFSTAYCSKKCLLKVQTAEVSASETLRHWCRTVRTLRHQSDGAEMSWVRSDLGPKCLDKLTPLQAQEYNQQKLRYLNTQCWLSMLQSITDRTCYRPIQPNAFINFKPMQRFKNGSDMKQFSDV